MENLKSASVTLKSADDAKQKPAKLAKALSLFGLAAQYSGTHQLERKGNQVSLRPMTPSEKAAKQKKRSKRKAQGKARARGK